MRDSFYDDMDRLRREELKRPTRADLDDPDEDDDDFDPNYLDGGTLDPPQDEDGSKPFYPPWPSTEDDVHRIRIAE